MGLHTPEPMPSLATLMFYLLAGTAVGLLALFSRIPAAPLAGALLGAGVLSMSGRLETATWPAGTKTMLEIGIGTVLGAGLTRTSLEQLQLLWRPALLITLRLGGLVGHDGGGPPQQSTDQSSGAEHE